MELAGIIFRQTLTMALYMLVGFVLYKTGKITKEGSKNFATMLIWLIIPAVIMDSFCVAFSLEKLTDFLVSALLGVLLQILSLGIARLIYPKAPLDQFAAAFSNAGFMGIPLVRACFGEEAVFFLVGYIACLNILQWTYGASLLQQNKKVRMKLKSIILNPICLSAIVGIGLFVTGLGALMPAFVKTAINGVAGLNGPLAMIVLGVYLAQTDLKTLFLQPRLYGLCVARLLAIPVISILFLLLIPADPTIKLVVLTAASAPVGSNVAVYAQLYDADYPYACQTVALSTVLSVLTMPLMLTLGNMML